MFNTAASMAVSGDKANAKTFYKEVKEAKMWTDKGEVELKKVIEDFKNGWN